jgi:hypothetical protein
VIGEDLGQSVYDAIPQPQPNRAKDSLFAGDVARKPWASLASRADSQPGDEAAAVRESKFQVLRDPKTAADGSAEDVLPGESSIANPAHKEFLTWLLEAKKQRPIQNSMLPKPVTAARHRISPTFGAADVPASSVISTAKRGVAGTTSPWLEPDVQGAVAAILGLLRPSRRLRLRRKQAVEFIIGVLRKAVGASVYVHGSVGLRTETPDSGTNAGADSTDARQLCDLRTLLCALLCSDSVRHLFFFLLRPMWCNLCFVCLAVVVTTHQTWTFQPTLPAVAAVHGFRESSTLSALMHAILHQSATVLSVRQSATAHSAPEAGLTQPAPLLRTQRQKLGAA